LGNSWFIVGVVFWCVGVAIVIATGSHFVHEWSMTKQKKGGHYTPPKENLPTSNDGAFVVEDEATLEGRVQNFEQNTVPGVDQPTIVRAQGKGTGIFDMANVKQTHILNPDGSVSGQMVISGPGDIITGADSTMILFPDDAPESED
jgi:hypothetical protein